MESREGDALGNRLRQPRIAELTQVCCELVAQLVEQLPRLPHHSKESRHLLGANAVEVVSDADIEHGVETRIVLEDSKATAIPQNLDQIHRFRVLHHRLVYGQFLRPFHVEANVGHMYAGTRNIELVVHLYGLEFDDAAARKPRENDILR